MQIPSYEELMPFVLKHATQEREVRETTEYISNQIGLSEDERKLRIPSGTDTIINSRLSWAISYLVQAGLLERPRRAHFIITSAGRKVLENDIDLLNTEYLKKIPEFVDFLNRKRKERTKRHYRSEIDEGIGPNVSDIESEVGPEEQISDAVAEIEADLKGQILTRILQNSPDFFEKLVVKLLSAMGYGGPEMLAQAIGKVGDGGIDGIIYQDKLGLDIVYIQAKRYKQEIKISRPELQTFVGTLAGVSAHKGVFVTTSDFSAGGLDYLRTVNSRVVTINGDRLVDLMLEHEVGVRRKQKIVIHRIDEDFFLED
jgi:restriction system protein